MNDEYFEIINGYFEKYRKAFGAGFPMYQLGRGRTDDEIKEIIDRCLAEGKDAYELGLVTDDEDVEY